MIDTKGMTVYKMTEMAAQFAKDVKVFEIALSDPNCPAGAYESLQVSLEESRKAVKALNKSIIKALQAPAS